MHYFWGLCNNNSNAYENNVPSKHNLATPIELKFQFFLQITKILFICFQIKVEEISRDPGKLLLVEYSVTGFPNDEEIHAEIVVSAGPISGNIFAFDIRAVGDDDYYNYNYKK